LQLTSYHPEFLTLEKALTSVFIIIETNFRPDEIKRWRKIHGLVKAALQTGRLSWKHHSHDHRQILPECLQMSDLVC
jgi:hypothetical protein